VSSPLRAPYGRRRPSSSNEAGQDEPTSPDLDPTPTYYGRPAIKKSHYRWLIATYFFVGGLAGASQIIATVADLMGHASDRAVVRAGRYLALFGALACPPLLVKDLHTPSRWYNMLRIFRPTSPMSIGSWMLLVFGTTSGLAAVGHALEDLFGLAVGSKLSRLFGPPAAGAGAVMSVYTGALLSSTSVPLWASGYRHLPALFGASAVVNATAAISLVLEVVGVERSARKRLELLGLLANVAELALSLALKRQWRTQGVAGPVERQPLASAHQVGVLGLGFLLPRAVHATELLTGRQWRGVSILGALSTLVGGFIQRAVLVLGGRESGDRPEDYFRMTQPGVGRPTRQDSSG
jgi:protein NrfD